ncbi:hypothetical protein [Sphingomonas sp. NIC1]|uniref:hypothetical protein n=1 Tax=Sphingomonas sp. NIC1 TaxID=1961362 RepID=UPI0007C0F869|nr:hypothetical protein [Sphingomonas sp. NIC1]ANC87329.1 hypothetical protein A7E77_10725 [Sphingomonas sp. NIC1]
MVHRRALTLALVLAATPAHTAPKSGAVTLLPPYETATPKAGSLADIRLKSLARIDPAHPLAGDPNLQTFSLFGREDLIAASSDDYRPTHCAPAKDTTDPLTAIIQAARKTSIVIINESHERSEHRGFTTALLAPLHAEGYTTLALEALAHPEPDTPKQYLPSFQRDPGLPYLEDEDGFYLGEAAFGRLGRTAKRLGYALVPYEAHYDPATAKLSQKERIGIREEGQANTLAAWVAAHPGAKLLVHVGYHHAIEVPTADGLRWMATRLKAKTGIDPLTISQTTCHGGGSTTRLAALPADEPPGTFDLVVDHPTARFVRGRPAWRIAAGDTPVSIPAQLRPTTGWRVIEARPDGEPPASVPMDRVAIRPGEDIALMLPPGRYRLRVLDVAYTPAPDAD